MRIVKVKFLSTYDQDYAQGYYYLDNLSRKLQKYDTVIVPTRYGMSLAVVQQVGVKEENIPCNVSNMKYISEKIKSKAVEDTTRLQKADDLKKELDKKIKSIDEVEKYRVYAELSPEVAELLKELENLKQ